MSRPPPGGRATTSVNVPPRSIQKRQPSAGPVRCPRPSSIIGRGYHARARDAGGSRSRGRGMHRVSRQEERMSIDIRRLGPGDEEVLATIAREADDFDLAGASQPEAPLDAPAAAAYLTDPAVVHWVAVEGGSGGRRAALPRPAAAVGSRAESCCSTPSGCAPPTAGEASARRSCGRCWRGRAASASKWSGCSPTTRARRRSTPPAGSDPGDEATGGLPAASGGPRLGDRAAALKHPPARPAGAPAGQLPASTCWSSNRMCSPRSRSERFRKIRCPSKSSTRMSSRCSSCSAMSRKL